MNRINKLSNYAPLILRLAIALVFLWFGFSQWADPVSWKGLIPAYILSITPISPTALIYLHGSFEVILGSLLLFGVFTRTVSALLTLNLLHITFIMGYGPIGARDLALTLATLAIFLNGSDDYCLDKILKQNKNAKKPQD